MLQTTSYQILNYLNCASFNLQSCLWLHSPILKGIYPGMEMKETLLSREGWEPSNEMSIMRKRGGGERKSLAPS